mmetsp:Transcript_35634/g.93525  ORF Transcript_35634/g.93525 Transcript_35634/m.93525 type:complete len:355 (+) Transcript_35634:71-1135(+)
MGDEVDPIAEAKAIMTPKKVLMVITSTDKYPDETPTGFWLTEATHPYQKWTAAGWSVECCSITGSAAVDPSSVEGADADSLAWKESNAAMLEGQLPTLESVVAREEFDFDVLFFSGGYGACWDFPENEHVKAVTVKMWEAGKIVAAVCHGPLALINVELGDGTKLLAGKTVTGFSNAEEEKMGKTDVVAKGSGPGSCEDMMGSSEAVEGCAGGNFECAGVFEAKVCIDGNLITGQNPPSAAPLADAVLYALDPIRAEFEPQRNALLEERAPIAKELQTKKEEFVVALNALKQDEKANYDKIDNLGLLARATSDWLTGQLQTIDTKLERVAARRHDKVSKYEKILADAAAAEAEE